jgi:predicted RNase H-like HicB family nuclease
MIKYTVIIKESEEGFSVWCPDLPGCCSQGDTEDEALENMSDAIREYLVVRKEVFSERQTKTVEIWV